MIRQVKRIVNIIGSTSKQPLKFLISGASAASIEYVSFLGVYYLFEDNFLILANILSFILGLTVSFILNKYWVFKSDGSKAAEFTKYFILAVINLGVSTTLIYTLVNIFSVVALFAKLITMIAVAVWNFFLFKTIVFKSVNKPNKDIM